MINCRIFQPFIKVLAISLFLVRTAHAAGNPRPILVLATDMNFGSYTCEMLKTEGFNEFEIDSLEGRKITPAYIRNFDVIILSCMALTTTEKEMFEGYVKNGGNLIAFRPDKKLCDVFGISPAGGTIPGGYIAISPGGSIGKGMITTSLQLHSEADEYNLQGAEKIASLYQDAVTETKYPAVVIHHYGRGYAMAFLYNLPENIIYTRQGNYRYAAREMDGVKGIRARDMFTNGWIDGSRNALNQADEQMRILSKGIEKMTNYTKPLPRFWYFPDTLKSLVILNNDGEDSKEAEFEPQFQDVYAKGARMTLYIKEVDLVSKAWVDKWLNKGFEISGHVDDTRQASNPDWKTMDSVYKDLIRKLNNKYGIPEMHTVVNHWFVWCGKDENGVKDFAAQAKIEEMNGIELDCNYAHSDNHSNQGHYLGPMGAAQGNFNGSGLIMRFSDIRGHIINVYQQINDVYDQEYMENKDPDGFYNCFKGLLDRSLYDGIYSFVTVKAHNAEYFFSKIPLGKMLDYANSKRIPVWTELKLLGFLKARDEASFSDINWENNRLSFKIKSALKHSNTLSMMIPYLHSGRKINKIISNAVSKPYSVETIKGQEYAMFTIQPGSDYNMAIDYIN